MFLDYFFYSKKRIPKILKPNYLNRHKGEYFLILANGRSIIQNQNTINQYIKKFNPIIMGSNFAPLDYELNYHVFTNRSRFSRYSNKIKKNSKILLSPYFKKSLIKSKISKTYEELSFINECLFQKKNIKRLEIKNGIINCNMRTVALLSIAIAFVMGAKKVFLAGLDGYDLNNMNNKKYFTNYYGNDLKYPGKHKDLEYFSHFHELNEITLKYLKELDYFFRKENLANYFQIITPTFFDKFYKK